MLAHALSPKKRGGPTRKQQTHVARCFFFVAQMHMVPHTWLA